MSRPLLLTLGDPNGLGPELVCRWLAGRPSIERPVVLVGPESALEGHAARLGLARAWRRLERPDLDALAILPDVTGLDATGCAQPHGLVADRFVGSRDAADQDEAARSDHRPGADDPGSCRTVTASPPGASVLSDGLFLLEPPGLESFSPEPGRFSASGGLAAGLSLGLACDIVLSGRASGIVTCPLNKAGLQAAGFDFPGHTEFLAARAGLGPDEVCMHLGGPRLRVSLVTTHPALRDVPSLITEEKVLRCLKLTVEHVRRLGLAGPVAVCGLNPHAGESGRIGDEEARVIEPALDKARSQGLEAAGPFPADTVFRQAYEGKFPAVLAMYHDQGLGPLKLAHFGQAVNVTLGLPFVRTSVDHGTGYDLVGRDQADMGSFLAAMDMAVRLADGKRTPA